LGTKTLALAFLALGLLPAAPFTVTSGGPTNLPDGSSTTPVTTNIDIVVSDTRTIIGGFSVSLNTFSHTWMGDLDATVTHIDTGTTTFLFNRPGRTTISGGAGASDDFGGTYSFIDSAGQTVGAWAAANIGVLPSGAYRAAQDSGTIDEQAILIANVFNGISAAGTWRLSLTDSATGDTGSLGSWTLNLDLQDAQNGVPEPATFAVSALGLIAIAALRRNR